MKTSFKILMTLGLMALLAACVMAQEDDDDFNRFRDNYSPGSKGPCPGGYWADGSGCCPEVIKGKAYYRDGNKCYPSDLDCGVFYADGCGCYPDESGEYLKDGESCPKNRQCHQRCIRPDEDCDETTTYKHYTTPKHETTTEKATTTEKHYTTPKRETTTEKRTTPKHETTTTEECKETTTTERRTTPKQTTTEECKETTTTERRTTPKHETTTEKATTTTEKHYTTPQHYETTTSGKYDRQCGYGQFKDGKGCCPRKMNKYFYYRDGQGCYPTATAKGMIFYADSNRCYPDENGKYLKAGQSCPASRVCKAECDGTSYY